MKHHLLANICGKFSTGCQNRVFNNNPLRTSAKCCPQIRRSNGCPGYLLASSRYLLHVNVIQLVYYKSVTCTAKLQLALNVNHVDKSMTLIHPAPPPPPVGVRFRLNEHDDHPLAVYRLRIKKLKRRRLFSIVHQVMFVRQFFNLRPLNLGAIRLIYVYFDIL